MVFEFDSPINNLPGELIQTNDDLLPNCPAHLTHPKDLGSGNVQAEQYYASQILEIDPLEEPPFHLLENKQVNKYEDMSDLEKNESRDFTFKYIHLIEYKDTCDKVGIKYLGKILSRYNPNSDIKGSLNGFYRNIISSITREENNEVVQLAKLWAGF